MRSMRLYREFTTQDELDREYNPSAAIPEAAATFARWQQASEQACANHPCSTGVAYGPTRAEYLDIFPAAPGSPTHIFLHGGYWRRFSARDHAFLGPPLAAAGLTTVIVNYELCPRVTIDEIVRQVRAAIAWTYKSISGFGGDPERLTVSGHSAGGHLTGMALATDWQNDYGLPSGIIKGALPISGLFDLAPFPYTYLQPALQLTWDQVRRNSPILLAPSMRLPVTMAVGGLESAEFKRQSSAYARHLEGHGLGADRLELDGRHHLSVLEGLADPTSPLQGALRRLAGLT
jgi:arylformamidase